MKSFKSRLGSPAGFWLVLGALIVVGVVSSSLGHHSKTAAAAASTGSPNISILTDSTTDNSCKEVDGDARIYVDITLRNDGDAAGSVEPWAAFDYSDGGQSTESYFTNYGHDIKVPAHTEVDATFYHTFNPYQHYMIRCTGYADINDPNSPGVSLR